jgi:alkaline phosphatase
VIKIRSVLIIIISFISLVYAQEKRPKNIIIMIGDGMGVNCVSASVISLDNDAFKRFKSIGFSETASADKLITDSAAGATAISTGYRTNNHWIAVDPETKSSLKSIFEYAEEQNLSTGVVVTSTVTNATPAAFLSHINDRNKEDVIASQYINDGVDVVIGGGLKLFIPKGQGGKSKDNIDLRSKIKSEGYEFYNNAKDIIDRKPLSKFYALIDSDGVAKASERNYTLGDLTKIAISNLSQNKNGFVLMIEGSQIDWAGHGNNSEYILSELKDFDTAINAALDFAEDNGNTLVVVTADHETGGLSINGGTKNGKNLELKYTTKGHTGNMVGVFAYGPGEEQFRGIYENYMIGRKLIHFVNPRIVF